MAERTVERALASRRTFGRLSSRFPLSARLHGRMQPAEACLSRHELLYEYCTTHGQHMQDTRRHRTQHTACRRRLRTRPLRCSPPSWQQHGRLHGGSRRLRPPPQRGGVVDPEPAQHLWGSMRTAVGIHNWLGPRFTSTDDGSRRLLCRHPYRANIFSIAQASDGFPLSQLLPWAQLAWILLLVPIWEDRLQIAQ
jgi:hypothetical protein